MATREGPGGGGGKGNPIEGSPAAHSHIVLEGKTLEEAADLLISDPRLVHFVLGTYKGSDLQKIASGGKMLSRRDAGLSDYPDFRGNKKKEELYRGRTEGAVPATFTFTDKKGFGIIFPYKDDFQRPGYSSFWILVPEHEKQTQAYLIEHPEILLKIVKEKFKEYDRSGGEQLTLLSRNFIDAN